MNIQTPHRQTHTYEQTLVRPAAAVFPLLCPVRETEWVDGWDPEVVITESGIAESEAVFVVDGATWTVTDYEPPEPYEEGLEAGGIAFVKFIPGRTVTHIHIHVWDHAVSDHAENGEPDGTSRARITYSMTALTETGTEEVDAFTRDAFGRFMMTWEDALNAHLGKDRSNHE